ncbi:MAG TPA: phosphoadenosine phosphosulfate reductase family protein, partial [Agromyces sp.]|nr:phosphoadenosine phosphosulfate reductase family protein [Agromyces sp.]
MSARNIAPSGGRVAPDPGDRVGRPGARIETAPHAGLDTLAGARHSTTGRRSADELRALAEAGNAALGSLTDHEASPAEVVAWVAANFATDAAAVACSMADAVLPHVIAEQLPGVDVLFLDTGYHFTETYVTRDEVARALDVRIVDVLPEQTVAEQEAE